MLEMSKAPPLTSLGWIAGKSREEPVPKKPSVTVVSEVPWLWPSLLLFSKGRIGLGSGALENRPGLWWLGWGCFRVSGFGEDGEDGFGGMGTFGGTRHK